jgi:hypothetical protein
MAVTAMIGMSFRSSSSLVHLAATRPDTSGSWNPSAVGAARMSQGNHVVLRKMATLDHEVQPLNLVVAILEMLDDAQLHPLLFECSLCLP